MGRRDPAPDTPLSKQELAVLTAIAIHGSDGFTLAAILDMPPYAVKICKYNIARKLGVSGRCSRPTAGAVAVALRTGLLNKSTLPPFANPTEEYRAARTAKPYLIRHDDGTHETINSWLRPRTGDKQ
jgi:hypothetical protein